jgi:hypothetical protein
MKTLEEIKSDLIASNPSTIFTFNDEEIQMSQDEIDKAIQDRAEMEYAQQAYLEELKNTKLVKISAYRKLGLEDAEIVAVMGLDKEEAALLIGGN